MRRLRVLLSGMIAADPRQGGATWAVLQYLLGLAALGHDVTFVEPIAPDAITPRGARLADSANARYFADVMQRYAPADAALLDVATRDTVGCSYSRLRTLAARADVLINISGLLGDEFLLGGIPIRVYLDLDPAFNQLWHAVQGIDRHFAGHTHFVTIGHAIGEPQCPVPTCGLDWIPTWQPVMLSAWPVADALVYDALTTIGNWRGYGSVEHNGVLFGQKAHSLRQFFPLPTLTREKFALALAIHHDEVRDLAALDTNGWMLLDPAEVAGSPLAYRAFVQGSKAEFGFAKSGYVLSRCGWFSDRSVCYLASGRPVIAHDTGFSNRLPVGSGLFAFSTIDDVLAAIDALNSDYPRHREAARAMAEEYFDSARVLTRLLERVTGQA